MFAVLALERDPMRIQEVPSQLMLWIQSAGGWAAIGVLAWLLFGYTRMRDVDRARIIPWHSWLFRASVLVAIVGYLIAGASLLLAQFPKITFSLATYQSYGFTIGGAGALIAAGLPFATRFSSLRFRRIWALALLSFKEAIRNRVLYGFSALLLVFLFGSWFIPHKAEYQVRSYVGVVYWVMKILLLVTAVILAAFSIPTDIRRQTIHTIITKPVERFEILLGRFLGFAGLMTLVLLLMTTVSIIYVLRGVDREAAEESLKARDPLYGELRFENTDDAKKGNSVGREWDYRGYITAVGPNRIPQAAIWEFPSVPDSLANRDKVRCEIAFDIYRQTKGSENRGVSCRFEFQTANFSDRDKTDYNTDHSRWTSKNNVFSSKDIDDWLAGYRARLSNRPNPPSASDIEDRLAKKRTRLTAHPLAGNSPQYSLSLADIDAEMAEEYGYYVVPAREITDFHTLFIDVPGGLFRNLVQGAPSTPARSPAPPPLTTRVSVTQQSATQCVGMAKYDLYWRLDDPHAGEWEEMTAFALNFYKGTFGLWLRLCLVIGLAVALSTYLSGVISMLVASMLYLGGSVLDFVRSIGEGTAPGGGPIESLVRLANRQVALIPLDEGATATLATSSDVVFRWFLRRVVDLIPDVNRYDMTSYVGEGFNIPWTQLLLDFGAMALYLLPWMILAYYLLKWREIAGPT
jgi:ABC-type transport system involved in multi-copper enzyme maturation permease subunit